MYMEEPGCYMRTKKLLKYFMPVGVLLAFTSMANASLVLPGGTVPPSAVPVTWGVSSIADTGSVTLTNGDLDVTLREQVFADTGGGLCAGCLDFVITATDLSTTMGRVTATAFAGFTTDVGVITGTGTFDPTSINRSANGNDIGFFFGTHSSGTADTLVIRTNGTILQTGALFAIDGGIVTTPAYGLAPEPNMAALLSVLAVGILGVAYRRKKNVTKNTEA